MRSACSTGAPRKNSPGTAPPAAPPPKSSPGTAPPAAPPRKNSPNAPEISVFRPFWACRANYFALSLRHGAAGRTISRTGRSNVATLKPMTPLQPLTQATMKPPSPLQAPQQRPLKPTTPLQPKNARNTSISHPQRRRRFQPHTWFAGSSCATSRYLCAHSPKKSHVIRLDEVSIKSQNVAIPTNTIQTLKQPWENYVRNWVWAQECGK